jgi:hypothetical protein
MIGEILVHVSTPATKQNERLYRSLADAYLDFEPQQTYRDGSRQDVDGQDPSSVAHLEDVVALEEKFRGSVPTESSILSTSKESYGSFPSYLSSGFHQERAENVITSPQPEQVDDGSVPTSSRLARLDRIHRHWKDQTTPKSSFVSGERPTNRIPSTPEDADTAFIEDTQLGAQALQSQLQDSYSTTSEDTSDDEDELEITLPNGSFGVDIQGKAEPKKPAVSALTGSKLSETTAPPRERHSSPSGLKVATQLSPTITPGPNKKQKTVDTNGQPTKAFDFSALSKDAYPPAPKISTEHFDKLPSQITQHLADLKSQNLSRFNSIKQHVRLPKPDDRGYWSITCSNWPIKTQHDFWTSLCDHVASGRLGWGTTLHRDTSSAHALGQVRLYCWAEVVEHTWLLLWFCSKGAVVGSGSEWVDADGKVVFEVV